MPKVTLNDIRDPKLNHIGHVFFFTNPQLSQKIPKNNLESFYKEIENINGMR